MVVLRKRNPCPPGFRLVDGACVPIQEPSTSQLLGLEPFDPYFPEPEP
jgi:hypothetical protein